MTNLSQQFKSIVSRALIEISFKDHMVICNAKKIADNYQYACYLIVNGIVTIKKAYNNQTRFEFDLGGYAYSDEISIKYYFQNIRSKERMSKTILVKESRKCDFFIGAAVDRFKVDKKLSELGNDLLYNFELKLGSFNKYNIGSELDFWEKDPFNNRSWQWRLHWFEFLNHLMAYHCQNGDEQALNFIRKIVDSWFDKYSSNPSDFEFIWHDHATALRAEILLILYYYIVEYCKDWLVDNKEFLQRIFEFLNISKVKLEEESFYSKHTNHGLEQARVLLLLGVFFDDILTQELAVSRILSELQYSFTSEGVHKENSPGYHQFVLKVFLGIISRFPQKILGDLKSEFDEIGSKALEFIAHILRPDAKFPIIGDTEFISATDSYSRYFKKNIEYQWYLYSTTQGKRGLKPVENLRVYPKSGYAIYRDNWDRKDFKNALHLILKAGCLSRYHHQQDESHIVLYAYGEDWLIDSGLYNYINSDPIRKHMRSRMGHNVPVISNSKYDDDFDRRFTAWSLDSGDEWISTTNSVLENIHHTRNISFLNKEIEIKDNIEGALDNQICFLWHIPGDKTVSLVDGVVNVDSILSVKTMKMQFTPKPDQIIISEGLGTSKYFNKLDKSTTVKVIYKSKKQSCFTTKIAYVEGINNDSN